MDMVCSTCGEEPGEYPNKKGGKHMDPNMVSELAAIENAIAALTPGNWVNEAELQKICDGMKWLEKDYKEAYFKNECRGGGMGWQGVSGEQGRERWFMAPRPKHTLQSLLSLEIGESLGGLVDGVIYEVDSIRSPSFHSGWRYEQFIARSHEGCQGAIW